jgi:hypothetical protein
MNEKILFFLDKDWIHFGIAKCISDKLDANFYGIVDLDSHSSNFFKEQDLMKFEKIWYYQDYIKNQNSPDLEYLKKFEEKYDLNIWEIALSERFFLHYNHYHHFDYDEILYILEKECRLFEEILDEVKPDFLIIKITDSHQSHLLHQLCKSKGIKTLMLGWTRFGNRCALYDEFDKFENFDTSGKKRTQEELENFLHTFHSTKAAKPMIKSKVSIFLRIKKYFRYLSLLNKPDVKSYYPHYGKNMISVLTQFISLKRKIRKQFIDKNFTRNISQDILFVYYPLHVEPERALLLVAPYFTNQLETITNISKSLPIDYKLFIKEHPAMELAGWRSISFYKELKNLLNVELVHPSVSGDEMIKNSSLVVTIGGSTGAESIFYQKPCLVFSDVSYSMVPTVKKIENIEELPIMIREMLGKTPDIKSLNDYVNLVENNTFEINLIDLHLKFQNYFAKEFNTLRSNVSVTKMKEFLQINKKDFETLANEHIKKINQSDLNK